MNAALNNEFYTLLETLNNKQTFNLKLTPRVEETSGEFVFPSIECKQLTTAQLKQLVESVVSNPLDLSSFGLASTNVFQSCIGNSSIELNVIDKQLFLLETRIHSLSPTFKYVKDEQEQTLSLSSISSALQQKLIEKADLFQDSTSVEGNLTIYYGVPYLKDETLLFQELYKNYSINVNDSESLKQKIGEAFIQEIAKTIRSIKVNDTVVNFADLPFESRIQVVENLPSIAIQPIIKYIEEYKMIIEECLTVNDYTLVLDSSLFNLR